MSTTSAPTRTWLIAGLALALAGVGLAPVFLIVLLAGGIGSSSGCGGSSPPAELLPPGGGGVVGATEYGGPGDPRSGHVGASGQNLLVHPDSYAELGGLTFQTATAMGGLPYMTPLRVTWGGHSAIAYKRDFGFGGGPIDGHAREIDLWWEFAEALQIPYEDGEWSGVVRVQRPPQTGAGNVLGQAASASTTAVASTAPAGCPSTPVGTLPITAGPRARIVDGLHAAAPADAPAAVKGIIAASNEIVGKPYVYGGGHGIALNEIAPAYDCSSSVEHLLYGGGLLPVDYDGDSTSLESFGRPGPGRWVTIEASPDHVFMYVAGLRWDTHAMSAGDGTAGIGWHPLVREDDGFVMRHPAGL